MNFLDSRTDICNIAGMRIKSFIVYFLSCFLSAGCVPPPTPQWHPSQSHLKVITYNVNWGFRNPGSVIVFLKSGEADIVFLQETNQAWEQSLKAGLSNLYPYQVFKNWPGAGGIAFLSKYKLKNIRLIQPAEGWFPALVAEAQTSLGLIALLNVHLRPSLSDQGSAGISALYTTASVRLREIQGFAKEVPPETPLVVAGDFNENENGSAVRWLIEQGLEDALSIYDSYTKTWRWKTSAGIVLKNRYDHILFSRSLHCTGADVTAVDASDHLPLSAVFILSHASDPPG